MNAITGLPRAGSTLLCNLLNQRDDCYASTTSILPRILHNISDTVSGAIEFKAALDRDRKRETERVERAVRAFVKGWYGDADREHVFDKSRGWTSNFDLFGQLWPQGKMIVLIRDLRNVFASIEKQDRRTGIFREVHASIWTRAENMFSPTGIIGAPLDALQDLLRRNRKHVFIADPRDESIVGHAHAYPLMILRYESLAEFPQESMAAVARFLGIKQAKHDIDNVRNTAQDPDGLYLYKFP
ncbi:hypothetical protein LCGC14_2041890, partial [marine sediment metagenome]